MNPKPQRKTGDLAEDHRIKLADEVAAFERYKAEILPQVREALEKGMSAQEILKKFAPLAAARTVSIALMEVDSGKALTAAKDIVDRADGKAKETREVRHKYEELTDDELDAQVLARAEEMQQNKSAAARAVPAGASGKKLH